MMSGPYILTRSIRLFEIWRLQVKYRYQTPTAQKIWITSASALHCRSARCQNADLKNIWIRSHMVTESEVFSEEMQRYSSSALWIFFSAESDPTSAFSELIQIWDLPTSAMWNTFQCWFRFEMYMASAFQIWIRAVQEMHAEFDTLDVFFKVLIYEEVMRSIIRC